MGITRRSHSRRADARTLGFEAAVGLADGRRRGRDRAPLGRDCPHCGSTGRIDMIDAPRVRAYLTCPDCAHEWDTGRFDIRVG